MLALLTTPVLAEAPPNSAPKPVLLYVLCHDSKNQINSPDDTEYKEVFKRLSGEFELRVTSEALTQKLLEGVRVLWMAPPENRPVSAQAPPMTPSEIEVVVQFVERGGGLIFMTHPEPGMPVENEASNRLLNRFGLVANHVNIGAKKQQIPRTTPLIGGLRWAAYRMCTLDVEEGGPLRPPVLVMNDLQQKTVLGNKDFVGVIMIWGKYGQGRIWAVADTGWLSNGALLGGGLGGINLTDQDNWEIMLRLTHWVAALDTAKP